MFGQPLQGDTVGLRLHFVDVDSVAFFRPLVKLQLNPGLRSVQVQLNEVQSQTCGVTLYRPRALWRAGGGGQVVVVEGMAALGKLALTFPKGRAGNNGTGGRGRTPTPLLKLF